MSAGFDRKSCKRCGNALPEGNVGIGECSSCGAMYGILPDGQHYIEAVFSEPERAPVPPLSGLRARWRGRFGQGPAFRASPRRESAGELTIHYSERGRPKDLALFAVTFAALLFVGWCFFRIGLRAWLFLPALLIGLIAYVALGRIRMRLSLELRAGLLTYTNVRHGLSRPVVLSIPANEIRQLYVVHVTETSKAPSQFELRSRMQDGNSVTLEAFLSPGLPLLLEQLVERALDIGDQAQAGELDRHVPVKRPSNVHAFMAATLVIICAITAVIVERSGGALQPIEVDDQAPGKPLALSFPTTLWFDAELGFARREPPGGAFPSIDGTPPSARFSLEFHRNGQTSAWLDCDPHELSGARLTIEEAGAGRTRYRIEGSLPGCSIRLEPGSYVLSARLQRLPAAESTGLVAIRLEPRFKRRLY